MALPNFRTIPERERDCTTDEQRELWATYGNDEDGVCGQRIPSGLQFDDDGHPFGQDQPVTQDQFERWWRRNPRHNLHFHVWRKPVIDPQYLWGSPQGVQPWLAPDYRGELNHFSVLRFNPFFLKVGPLFIGYRADKPAYPGASWWPEDLGPGGGAWDWGAKFLHYP